MKLGFIGIGVMGNAICKNLINSGYELNIYTRTKNKAQEILDMGANYMESPKEVALNSQIIFTMVGYPKDVEEIYYSENGIFYGISSGKIVVDLTTSTPTLAKKIAEDFNAIDVETLDAPVSGGDKGAKNATLTIMVGGCETTFNIVRPIFDVIGKTVVLQGKSGSGQHTKMCNQIALAGNMLGAIELIVYAKHAGLDPNLVIESVNSGSAKSAALDLYASRILDNDYEAGFYLKHFVKDLSIAINEIKLAGIDLPCLNTAYRVYKLLEDDGLGELGTQALIKYYEGDYE